MSTEPTETVRATFEAFLTQDLTRLRKYVHPDLAWTFLDPASEHPTPDTCYGRDQLEQAAQRWATMGLTTELEELEGIDDKVVVILHAPGLDRYRARTADDRNFHLVTVRDAQVIAIRACHDRDEARALAGLLSDG